MGAKTKILKVIVLNIVNQLVVINEVGSVAAGGLTKFSLLNTYPTRCVLR